MWRSPVLRHLEQHRERDRAPVAGAGGATDKDIAGPLADRARQEVLDVRDLPGPRAEGDVLAHEISGGQLRVRAARLPAVTALDDVDSTSQRSVKKQVVLHLAQLDFLLEVKDMLLFGQPGTGRTHLSSRAVVRAHHHAEIIDLKGDSYRLEHRKEGSTTD